MAKWILVIGLTFALLGSAASDLGATVDTRLVLGYWNHLFGMGIGTLKISLQARSNGASVYFDTFQGAIEVDELLAQHIIYVDFSNHRLPEPDYNHVETVPNATSRQISYSYTLAPGGTAARIGANWRQVVLITIKYVLTNQNAQISWSDDPPDYQVIDINDTDLTGEELELPTDLTDISLPVQLSAFRATYLKEGGVRLFWRTESEIDNAGFQVWKGHCFEEAENFECITAELIPGHGSSTTAHVYAYIDVNALSDEETWYMIEQIDLNGRHLFFGPIQAKQLEEVEILPSDYTLMQNHPNPFNPSTAISYALPEETQVILEIFNINGRLVSTLVDARQSAGLYTATWDGRDSNGRFLGSGIYFYKLNTPDGVLTKKMTLIR